MTENVTQGKKQRRKERKRPEGRKHGSREGEREAEQRQKQNGKAREERSGAEEIYKSAKMEQRPKKWGDEFQKEVHLIPVPNSSKELTSLQNWKKRPLFCCGDPTGRGSTRLESGFRTSYICKPPSFLRDGLGGGKGEIRQFMTVFPGKQKREQYSRPAPRTLSRLQANQSVQAPDGI